MDYQFNNKLVYRLNYIRTKKLKIAFYVRANKKLTKDEENSNISFKNERIFNFVPIHKNEIS